VFDFHKAFSTDATRAEVDAGCRSAGIGCVDCKRKLLGHLEPALAPVQERRRGLDAGGARVREILAAGAATARREAASTMRAVRSAMHLDTGTP
jgi:tryptophanyl-tRNA synthetase